MYHSSRTAPQRRHRPCCEQLEQRWLLSGDVEQIAHLVAAAAAQEDNFGKTVAAAGNIAVVGARGNDDAGDMSGSTYVFEGPDWQQTAKLTASDGKPGDDFGFKVAASDDTVAVSARFHNGAMTNTGAAYVFVRNTDGWTQQAKLIGDQGNAARFGFSIAMSGDRIAVGQTGDDDAAKNAGAVYLFGRDNGIWTPLDKLTIADGEEEDAFGFSVAISDTIVVGGAEFDDTTEVDTGSAYVFQIGSPPKTIGIDEFVVGDGSPQRSTVRQLTMTFDAVVTVGDDAIVVQQVGGSVVDADYVTEVVDGKTIATVFLDGLTDGNYEVRVRKEAVYADETTLSTDVVESFFQLFGDVDGDRTVGFPDFARFAETFGASVGEKNYEDAFDFNGNDTIDFADFVAFAERFGAEVPAT